MECMHGQTRPQFILSSERVLGNGVKSHVNSMGKIPSAGGSDEDRTRIAASHRTVSPTQYRRCYSGPDHGVVDCSTGKVFEFYELGCA